jgi:hypothetical protein
MVAALLAAVFCFSTEERAQPLVWSVPISQPADFQTVELQSADLKPLGGQVFHCRGWPLGRRGSFFKKIMRFVMVQ